MTDFHDILIHKSQATTVLRRKRANRNNIEETTHEPSLKRECIEERCDFTESSEIITNSNSLEKFYQFYKLCSNQAIQNLNLNNTRRRKNLRAKPSRREKSYIKKCLNTSGILNQLAQTDNVFISPKARRRYLNSQNNGKIEADTPESKDTSTSLKNQKSMNNEFLSPNPCSSFYNNCHSLGTIKCQPLEGDRFKCLCKENYTGTTCNLKLKTKQKDRVLEVYKSEANLRKENPVANFEVAAAVTESNEIDLNSQNSKKYCDTDLDCNSRGTCLDGICYCESLGFSGKYCQNDINECETGQHQCGLKIHCQNTIGSYFCQCSSGYELSDSGECVDINECNQVGKCDLTQARCVNTPGSFTCQCTKTGFQSVLVGKKFTCENINECSQNNAGCDQICIDTHGSYACNCEAGYILAADDHTCQNINECLINNGNCRNSCIDTPGSYYCECDPGWVLSADGVSCVDVNECTNGSQISCDLETSKCVNTEGSYTCECQTNYLKDPRTGICHATDQCKFDLHRCIEPAYCVTTTPGNYRCECPAGYNLSGRYRCVDINECLLDFGMMPVSSTAQESDMLSKKISKQPICGKGYCKNTEPGYFTGHFILCRDFISAKRCAPQNPVNSADSSGAQSPKCSSSKNDVIPS